MAVERHAAEQRIGGEGGEGDGGEDDDLHGLSARMRRDFRLSVLAQVRVNVSLQESEDLAHHPINRIVSLGPGRKDLLRGLDIAGGN